MIATEPAMQAADPAAVAAWLRSVLRPGAALRADSRAIAAGDAFFAVPGARADGRRFVADAIVRGAAAVVYDPDGFSEGPAAGCPAVAVPALRRRLGAIAAAYHEHPSRRLRVHAVTGTNGKTSCSHWIAQGLEHAGRPAAVVGTLGAGRVGALSPATLTTPDALELQRLFAGFVADGVGEVAIEASSIGLEQGRLDATSVEVAIFTNLTRDHLDYHGSMAEYARCKASLFGFDGLHAAVVNLDDPAAPTMLDAVRAGARRIGYCLGAGPVATPEVDAMLVATEIAACEDGTRVEIDGDFGRAVATLALIGDFNVSNALAVAGAWLAAGVELPRVASMLEALRPVPGRLQRVVAEGAAAAPLVVVDYAHTADALANVLATLQPLARARGGALWCVFGAGGDRDSGKRAAMGEVAERDADRVVVTSDNPRGEPPQAIIDDIRAGLGHEPAIVDVDRARAIRDAIAAADAADVVLIAGKGHEDYQEIAGRRLPFSDVDHARRALAERERGGV